MAQKFLLQALERLDPTQFSRVRAAVACALGKFQQPQREEMAHQSAQALQKVLEAGDISYRVEFAAAEALGKTRTEGSVDLLTKLIARPNWNNYVQRGIFSGLGSTGEDRVVDIMAGYLLNTSNHPTLRRGAAVGLGQVGRQRHLYSQEARERAVTTLCVAVEHDSWGPVRSAAAQALMELHEKRAIEILERRAVQELDSGVQRSMRVAAHALRTSDEKQEQMKQLRKDLDELREENRKLKEQLNELEARIK
jgi:aminopeptidase N